MKTSFQLSIITITIIVFSFLSSNSIGSINLPEKACYKENNVSLTRLVVFVLDKLGNRQKGAKVTLYTNEEDYINQKNSPFETIISDKKGRVIFKNLKPIEYFIHIVKGDLNNNGNGVKSQPLTKNRVNKLNIVID